MVSSIRLLIVEDHHTTRKGLELELSSEADMTVVGTAAGHLDGMQMVQSLQPDVVLLDLHLPDSQGPKTLTSAWCGLPNTRIIVFSGDSRPALVQLVLEAGVDAFLLKSEPTPEVADAIRKVMNGQFVVSDELLPGLKNKLTPAEKHLLRLLARGMKYQDIAAQRVTSPETVRKQVEQLIVKLSLGSREELIAWSVDNGYGQLEIE
jgi:DNA-binding NarL/FixJ family response regulator